MSLTAWSIQSASFDLSKDSARYDHTKGQYWNWHDKLLRDRYRKLLLSLQERFSCTQILWSMSQLAGWARSGRDDVAWKLTIPRAYVLCRFDSGRWSDLLFRRDGRPHDLSDIMIDESDGATKRHEVLVRLPLNQDCRIEWFASMKDHKKGCSFIEDDEVALWESQLVARNPREG